MHGPIIPATLGVLTGVVWGFDAAPGALIAALWVALVLAGAAFVFMLARRRPGSRVREDAVLRAGAWALAGLSVGAVFGWRHAQGLAPDHVVRLLDAGSERAVLVGTLDEPARRRSWHDPPLRWTSFVVRAEAVTIGGRSHSVSGRVRVFVWRRREPVATALTYGTRIRCSGTLSLPRAPTNPGQFDWRRRAIESGVRAVMSVPRHGALEVLARGRGSALWRVAYAARAWLAERLREVVPGREGALLCSVLLGIHDDMPETLRSRFAGVGVAHLLAISGLHLALLAALVGVVLRVALRVPLPLAQLGVMAFALGYCVLTGARPPVVRATVMLVMMLGGWFLRREAHALTSLALAALVIVLGSPGSVFLVGFHLSFVAVLGLVLLARPIASWVRGQLPRARARDPRLKRMALLALARTADLVVASSVAWVVTAPIAARVFHMVTPWGVLANVALALLFSALLAFGLLALVGASLGAPAAIVLSAPASWLAGALIAAIDRCAALPGAPLYLPDLPVSRLVAAYACLAAGAFVVRRRVASDPDRWPPMASWRALAAIASLVLAMLTLWPAAPLRPGASSARVTVLDVSNGSAAIVEGPSAVALIDCGSSRIQAGARYVAPALWRRGLTRIDHLILSHAHRDHLSALPELLERFEIGTAHVGALFGRARRGREVLSLLRRHGVVVKVVARGDRIGLGEGVFLDVLAPERWPAAFPQVGDDGGSERALLHALAERTERSLSGRIQNEYSVVVRLVTNAARVLFPGDLEERGTERLLELPRSQLGAEVLVLPHHGRRNERARALARAVRPRLAIASAGRAAADPATLCVFEDEGAEVRETAQGGAVVIECGSKGLRWRSIDEAFVRGW